MMWRTHVLFNINILWLLSPPLAEHSSLGTMDEMWCEKPTKGKPVDEVHKARIAEAQKKRWAQRKQKTAQGSFILLPIRLASRLCSGGNDEKPLTAVEPQW